MKYCDIITLRSMRPAYNIQEESSGEWKTFIANDRFNDILNRMIKSVIMMQTIISQFGLRVLMVQESHMQELF